MVSWDGLDQMGARRTMPRAKRKELAEFITTLQGAPVPENETAVEYKVAGPVLELLGWDVYSNLQWRRQIGSRRTAGVVDVALLDEEGAPQALIEAKAPNESLDKHLDQLLRYAFHETAQICVLTNGMEWWFYLPRAEGEARDRRFAQVDFRADVTEAVDRMVRFLSADRVLSGKAAENAATELQKVLARRKAADALPEVWRRMREEPDRALVRLVTTRVANEIGHSPDQSDVADLLLAAQAPLSGVAAYPKAKTKEGVPEKTPEKKRKTSVKAETLIDDAGQERGIDSWQGAMVEIVEFLARAHPGQGTVWAEFSFCATERYERGRNPFIPGVGLYVDTHCSSPRIRSRCAELLTAFGRDPAQWKVRLKDGTEVSMAE